MDDKQNTGSPDRDRININEDYELQYWAKKFGVTTEELKTAVSNAGTMAQDVEQELNKR